MQVKNQLSRLHILWIAIAWIIGLTIIFIVWTILSATVYKDGELPNIGKCFVAAFNILFKGYRSEWWDQGGIHHSFFMSISQSWISLIIAFAQAIACFVGSFILALGFVILSRYFKWIHYLMLPFVTLARSLPTAVLMGLIAVFLITVMPLVPIVVAFFIIFPMLYAGINIAINNVSPKNIEMANVFRVSKWQQIKNIYLPETTPYIFSLFVAGFGLTFKIALASQMVQGLTIAQPNYPSIGMYIAYAINAKQYAYIIGWGIIAIFISLTMELVINQVGRLCMPSKYKDRYYLKRLFHWSKHD